MVHWLIKERMDKIIPLNRLLGIIIEAVEDGRGAAKLPFREDLTNHIGTVHATAIFGLAEAASGCAMSGALAPMIVQIKPVAAGARIDYEKAASGELSAVAVTTEPPRELRARLSTEKKVRFGVDVQVFDGAGSRVAVVAVDWHVTLRS